MVPLLVLGALVLIVYTALWLSFYRLTSFATFFYSNFLKPHSESDGAAGQQVALESFYKVQVYPTDTPLPCSHVHGLTARLGQRLR